MGVSEDGPDRNSVREQRHHGTDPERDAQRKRSEGDSHIVEDVETEHPRALFRISWYPRETLLDLVDRTLLSVHHVDLFKQLARQDPMDRLWLGNDEPPAEEEREKKQRTSRQHVP